MIDATYSQQWLPEFQGNLLIEALPLKVDDETVLRNMSEFYPITDQERSLEKYQRVDFLYRLKRFRQPLLEYLSCYRMIESALREGYCPRDPLSPQTTHYIHHLNYGDTEIIPRGGLIAPEGTALSVIGESGIGKTKMLEQVLKCFDQTIKHTKYKGINCSFSQVVWLKVKCPHNASLSSLCRKILKELDRALGRPLTTPARQLDSLIEQLEMQIRNNFVGIIILDEMQNLSLQKMGGKEQFIRFILNLIDRSGIPVLFCANPIFVDLIRSEFKTARRAEASGFIFMRRMSKEVWDIFVPTLWSLQVTNVYTPLSKDMSESLYAYSQGIVDIAVRIFRQMQIIAIDGDDEALSVALIDAAYEEACQLTHKGLDLLREANLNPVSTIKREALNRSYNDLIADIDYEFLNEFSEKEKSTTVIANPDSDGSNIEIKNLRHVQLKRERTADPLTKIHHPELEKQILKILEHPKPAELIVESDLMTQLLSDPSDPRYRQIFLEHLGEQ